MGLHFSITVDSYSSNFQVKQKKIRVIESSSYQSKLAKWLLEVN